MEYCPQHALGGMVDVCSKKCRTEGCGKLASFGVLGTKMVEYCAAQHAPEGMVDVKNKKCRTEGCGKLPSFRCRYKNGGVLCTGRTEGDARRQEQKV